MGSRVMEPDDIATYAQIFRPGENDSSICLSIRNIYSRGTIFLDANPLDYSVPLLLAQLSLASFAIIFSTALLKPLGQPSSVIQIFGGLSLGPSFLGRIGGFVGLFYPYTSLVVLDSIALFGYMFYFFLIGVQIDPWILKRVEKKEFIIGVSTVATAIVLGITTSMILRGTRFVSADPTMANSIPIVATVSSVLGFPVIAHYLTELRMVNSDFGRMALSCSLVSNMFGFVIISVTSLSTTQTFERFSFLQNLATGIGFAMVIFFGVRPAIVWGTRGYHPGEPLAQNFICTVFIGVLLSGFCTKALGLHLFYGPLLFGLAIPAGPPLGSALVEKLQFLVSWLFMPIYFVKTGLVTDIFSVKLRNYFVYQSVILVACMGKFFGAFVSSICNQVSFRDAVSIGLVSNVQGVLELGMFKMMKQNEAIDDEAFVVLIISLLISTGITTPMLKFLYDPHRRYAAHRTRNLQHLKPHAELRVLVCVHDQENVPATINLLETLHPSSQSYMDIAMFHLIELVGRAHPLLINHKLPLMKHEIEASASKRIVNAFTVFERNFRETVSMHPFTAISPYVLMHDEVCMMALERRASLVIIPFHKKFGNPSSKTGSKVGVKIMNDKILQTAPCSVAVVVDRSLVSTSRPILEAWSQYRVAVFFLGGPDDREALALGERMAGKQNISLTIVRLLEEGKVFAPGGNQQETMDNGMVNETRSHMAGNYRVKYVEKTIRDGTGTVAVMRSMEDEYELIIVGRRHDIQSPLLVGLSDWIEESELGAVGDMFALADSDSHSTILVVQQHIG